jgi:hypothetical protein
LNTSGWQLIACWLLVVVIDAFSHSSIGYKQQHLYSPDTGPGILTAAPMQSTQNSQNQREIANQNHLFSQKCKATERSVQKLHFSRQLKTTHITRKHHTSFASITRAENAVDALQCQARGHRRQPRAANAQAAAPANWSSTTMCDTACWPWSAPS